MQRFIARRLVATVPLLILISILAFSLILLLPGDPALAILGDEVANANDRQAYFALPLLQSLITRDSPGAQVLPIDTFPSGNDRIGSRDTAQLVADSEVDAVIIGNAA